MPKRTAANFSPLSENSAPKKASEINDKVADIARLINNNKAKANDPLVRQLFQICQSLVQQLEQQQQTILQQEQTILQQNQHNTVEEAIQEQERRRSIVVMGLPESAGPKPSDRVAADRTAVSSVLDELGIKCPISNYRMGSPHQAGSGHGRPRLMKIIFHTPKFQHQALAEWNKKRGAMKQQDKWKNMNIRPSLSPAELDARRQLQKECTEKRKDGRDWVIYAGMVIERSNILNFHKKTTHGDVIGPEQKKTSEKVSKSQIEKEMNIILDKIQKSLPPIDIQALEKQFPHIINK
ncbi:hypothetical protein niasHT_000089 [Heterodera trifolii]|uniref:Uncharacterized protein n=1 Tax=Heterodera trifolii TaxID=157864 RepID=A0ABD2LVQ8_9BILA